MFAERETEKIYWAIVKNTPSETETTLVHYLKRNPKQNKSYAHIKEVPDSKKAILHYKLLKQLDNYCLLEIVLETGRHHQIRSQLSAIGCPIKGDLKYGFDRSNPDGSIHLHARKLKLIHPVLKEEMIFPYITKICAYMRCLKVTERPLVYSTVIILNGTISAVAPG